MNDNTPPTDTAITSPVGLHLFDKLMVTAANLQRHQVVADEELIAAFLAVAVTIAEATKGPAFAADMVRRMAETEVAATSQTIN